MATPVRFLKGEVAADALVQLSLWVFHGIVAHVHGNVLQIRVWSKNIAGTYRVINWPIQWNTVPACIIVWFTDSAESPQVSLLKISLTKSVTQNL